MHDILYHVLYSYIFSFFIIIFNILYINIIFLLYFIYTLTNNYGFINNTYITYIY